MSHSSGDADSSTQTAQKMETSSQPVGPKEQKSDDNDSQMAEDEEKCQNIQREKKSSEIKDCVPHQDNQAADNTETSQPDSPEEEDKPNNMDPKSEPPAAENMETSPSQPDCSKETSVNREEEEQSAVSRQAAESNSEQTIKRLHSTNDTELSPDNQSDSHHQKKIQEEKMAEDREKCQKIPEELKRSEIKDCVPHQDNQAADNTETSQPDRPEEEDKPDDMYPKSEPPAAENMETSPSQPDCSKETSVNREEEEEQPAVSLQAAESNSEQTIKRLHSANDTELSPENQSDSHHQKKIQEEKMAVYEEKWQKILRELKSSEIKDCVPYAENVIRKRRIHPNDVVDLLADVVKSLPSKKLKTDADSSTQPAQKMETSSQPVGPKEQKKSDDNDSQMAVDEEKWQKILRELKSSEIKDCVPYAENVIRKRRIHPNDVVDLLADVVKSLPSKKLKTDADSSTQPAQKMETSSQPVGPKEQKKSDDNDSQMAEDEEKCQNIQREQKRCKIKDCVPCDQNIFTGMFSCFRCCKRKTARSWIPRVTPVSKVACVVTGETFGAHQTIVGKLENRIWTESSSVQECDIIIVFCPIFSRIGSDVGAVKSHAAVSSTNKPVIVVLMHHTRDEEFSPGGRKWFEDPRFVLEAHVLFHQTQRGLLQCAHNDQAVREIQRVIQTH
ncbi:enolase-phosphatase E1-like isoform X2 [Parambassis ranga]|uniref:Enolase-phosphatase E1-like isoform X2 n=1 Tax=Parambassis ranga TaxID=210632 RepID=A0A6P7H6M2_9TELE|nr:enolase-phosphatase E1-like isoform X2 [Parambassis ranga]